jgi:hypothetical protein
MNFGSTSVSPSSGGLEMFIQRQSSNAHIRRRKSCKDFTNEADMDITQFLNFGPKLKLLPLSSKSAGRKQGNSNNNNLVLVQSQSKFNNSTTQQNRPHSTPFSRSFDSGIEDKRQGGLASSVSKSRLPDIQMINKYYGLVPKKFTVQTRQSWEELYANRYVFFECFYDLYVITFIFTGN